MAETDWLAREIRGVRSEVANLATSVEALRKLALQTDDTMRRFERRLDYFENRLNDAVGIVTGRLDEITVRLIEQDEKMERMISVAVERAIARFDPIYRAAMDRVGAAAARISALEQA